MHILNRLVVIVACNLVLIFASSTAHAALIVSWSFDKPYITAQPSDRIPITATITNDAGSDQTFDPFELNSWGYWYVSESLAHEYYELRDPAFEYPGSGSDLWAELGGLVLDPGESYQFLFFVLVPSNGITGGGSVPIGVYTFGIFDLNFDGVGYNSENNLTVTVVPIPAAAGLLLSGIAALAGFARVKSRN